jgi:hypothetical protein
MEKLDKNDPHYAYMASTVYKKFVRNAYYGTGHERPEIPLDELINVFNEERKLKPGEFLNKTYWEYIKKNLHASLVLILKNNISKLNRMHVTEIRGKLEKAKTSDQIMEVIYEGMGLLEQINKSLL